MACMPNIVSNVPSLYFTSTPSTTTCTDSSVARHRLFERNATDNGNSSTTTIF